MRGPAITLVATGLAGCSPLPDVVGLQRDPSFTYEALSAAPFAVFGVSVEDPVAMSASASLQLGNLMAESLKTKRRDLTVLPATHVADGLGLRDYTWLVREYQAAGSLDEGALSRVAAALDGVRYVALARLETDELTTGESVEEYTDERGGEVCDVERRGKFATRTLAVQFTVYDLHQRHLAWTGRITELEERMSSDEWNSCDPLLVDVLTLLLSGGDADPPELADVLKKVFEDFALHLPRA